MKRLRIKNKNRFIIFVFVMVFISIYIIINAINFIRCIWQQNTQNTAETFADYSTAGISEYLQLKKWRAQIELEWQKRKHDAEQKKLNTIMTINNDAIDSHLTHDQTPPTARSSNNIDRASSQYLYMRTLLAKLIYHEAVGEPYEGKIAVGAVVMNRAGGDFSKIEEVIFEPHQFSYFTRNRANEITPTEECYKAADEALTGVDPVDGAKWFVNLKLCNPDFIKSLTFVKRIGDHWFYK